MEVLERTPWRVVYEDLITGRAPSTSWYEELQRYVPEDTLALAWQYAAMGAVSELARYEGN